MSSFALREARASDSRALAELAAGSADTGQVAFSPRYRLPVVDVVRAKHPGAVGVVAEAAGHPGLVGAGWISPGTCRLGERTVPSALLHALTVHPSWRRRGIATALTAWRLARAAEQFGEETLVYAGIQEGNAASLANARRWARQVTGRLVVAPVPMRRRPPTRRPGVTVRAMRADEADVLAGVLAEQYRDCELAPCDDAGQIRAWLARSPAGTP